VCGLCATFVAPATHGEGGSFNLHGEVVAGSGYFSLMAIMTNIRPAAQGKACDGGSSATTERRETTHLFLGIAWDARQMSGDKGFSTVMLIPSQRDQLPNSDYPDCIESHSRICGHKVVWIFA